MAPNPRPTRSPGRLALARFFKNKAAAAALLFLAGLAAAGAAGKWSEGRLYPPPGQQNLSEKLAPPSHRHFFGTEGH